MAKGADKDAARDRATAAGTRQAEWGRGIEAAEIAVTFSDGIASFEQVT